MITLYDLYNSFKATVNTFQGGHYPPATIFTDKVNDISLDLWVKWVRQSEKSQEARDNLRPFLVRANIPTTRMNNQYSFAKVPTDYGRYASASILIKKQGKLTECVQDETIETKPQIDETVEQKQQKYYDNLTENQVDNVDLQRWRACLGHLTKMPTIDKPKMMEIEGGFYVAPKQVSVVVLSYYKQPKKATFDYTVSAANVQTGSGDYQTYNAITSKSLEWDATLKNEFLIELGIAFGCYTRDAFIAQISSQQKQQS